MFSTLRGFLNRHRRKFIVSGLVVGGFLIVTRYSQRKIREWREEEVRELLQRSRRNQHFESTERSCNQTIVNLAGCLRTAVTKSLDTESVVNQLRNGSCKDKIATWNELKTLAISRSAVVIYSITMLVATLRVQLNLMGGHMFKSSQSQENGGGALDEAVQEEYLTLCSHLMDSGIDRLSELVREKVEEITRSTSLSDKLTLRDLEQIYWSIMSSVAADATRDPVKNITSYMLPANIGRREENPVLSRMIDETLDLLESEEVQNLVQSTVRSGFVLLIDHVSEYFIDPSIIANGKAPDAAKFGEASSSGAGIDDAAANCLPNGYMNLNKLTMPMAKIIPIINGQIRDTPKPGDLASDWLQFNIVNDKLKTLGANVYEAFSF